jgi:hypothetical protein
MEPKCKYCGGQIMRLAPVLIAWPFGERPELTKGTLRKSDTSIVGVVWERAQYYCKSCGKALGTDQTKEEPADELLRQEWVKTQSALALSEAKVRRLQAELNLIDQLLVGVVPDSKEITCLLVRWLINHYGALWSTYKQLQQTIARNNKDSDDKENNI